jgi:hypothetical protein
MLFLSKEFFRIIQIEERKKIRKKNLTGGEKNAEQSKKKD